jgi:hypothetical protein
VIDVCRQTGISEATFHTWKKKFADPGVTELRKLKQLENENARLKRMVAHLTLDLPARALHAVPARDAPGRRAAHPTRQGRIRHLARSARENRDPRVEYWPLAPLPRSSPRSRPSSTDMRGEPIRLSAHPP